MPRNTMLFAPLLASLLLVGCGSNEEDVITEACMASFHAEAGFCSCLGETVVESLNSDELEAYTEAVTNALERYNERGGARIRLFPVPKLYRYTDNRSALGDAIPSLYRAEEICRAQD